MEVLMENVATNFELILLEDAAKDDVKRFVVGAIVPQIIENKVNILVLRRASGEFMADIEELPSGRVEEGETLLGSLARELHEETGLIIERVYGYAGSFDYLSASGKRTRQ